MSDRAPIRPFEFQPRADEFAFMQKGEKYFTLQDFFNHVKDAVQFEKEKDQQGNEGLQKFINALVTMGGWYNEKIAEIQKKEKYQKLKDPNEQADFISEELSDILINQINKERKDIKRRILRKGEEQPKSINTASLIIKAGYAIENPLEIHNEKHGPYPGKNLKQFPIPEIHNETDLKFAEIYLRYINELLSNKNWNNLRGGIVTKLYLKKMIGEQRDQLKSNIAHYKENRAEMEIPQQEIKVASESTIAKTIVTKEIPRAPTKTDQIDQKHVDNIALQLKSLEGLMEGIQQSKQAPPPEKKEAGLFSKKPKLEVPLKIDYDFEELKTVLKNFRTLSEKISNMPSLTSLKNEEMHAFEILKEAKELLNNKIGEYYKDNQALSNELQKKVYGIFHEIQIQLTQRTLTLLKKKTDYFISKVETLSESDIKNEMNLLKKEIGEISDFAIKNHITLPGYDLHIIGNMNVNMINLNQLKNIGYDKYIPLLIQDKNKKVWIYGRSVEGDATLVQSGASILYKDINFPNFEESTAEPVLLEASKKSETIFKDIAINKGHYTKDPLKSELSNMLISAEEALIKARLKKFFKAYASTENNPTPIRKKYKEIGKSLRTSIRSNEIIFLQTIIDEANQRKDVPPARRAATIRGALLYLSKKMQPQMLTTVGMRKFKAMIRQIEKDNEDLFAKTNPNLIPEFQNYYNETFEKVKNLSITWSFSKKKPPEATPPSVDHERPYP